MKEVEEGDCGLDSGTFPRFAWRVWVEQRNHLIKIFFFWYPEGDCVYGKVATNYWIVLWMFIAVKIWSDALGFDNLQPHKWVTSVCRSVFLGPYIYTAWATTWCVPFRSRIDRKSQWMCSSCGYGVSCTWLHRTCDRGQVCQLKCFVYGTLPLSAQCSTLLAEVRTNCSLTLYLR